MQYTVYVLKSVKNAKRYVGVTSKDAQTRLKEHNLGSNKYTRNNHPYVLLYYEKEYCKVCALKRELFLKSGQGRKILDAIEGE